MRLLSVFLAGSLLVGTATTQAQTAIDWRKQFSGLDGVSVSCVHTLEKKYNLRICENLKQHAATALKKMGVIYSVEDTIFSKSNDPIAVQSTSLKKPLNLAIHVRSTAANPLGMDVRIQAGVTMEQATDTGDNTHVRRGELLIWQTGVSSAVSRGSKRLERAVVKIASKRMDGFLDLVAQHWPL